MGSYKTFNGKLFTTMEPDRLENFENPEEDIVAVGPASEGESAPAAPSTTEVDPSSPLSKPRATEETETASNQSAEPQPPAPGPTLPAVLEHLAGIRSRMDSLQKDFESKIKYDQHKEKIIDELHRELQDYRGNMVKKTLQAMIMDVIKVADDIRKFTKHYCHLDEEDRNPDKLLKYLETIPQDLEDVLNWQDVRSYSCDSTSAADPRRQRSVKKISTTSREKDKSVAESLHPGYEWEGRVIRPEKISVYVYQQPEQARAEMREPNDPSD
jgi:molecular chaperone GrpE (heat shock protein)